MLGAAEDNPSEFGLIPRICFNLFEYFDAAKERSVKCSLEFSFLQIYNENLKDCLAPHSSAVLKGCCGSFMCIIQLRFLGV